MKRENYVLANITPTSFKFSRAIVIDLGIVRAYARVSQVKCTILTPHKPNNHPRLPKQYEPFWAAIIEAFKNWGWLEPLISKWLNMRRKVGFAQNVCRE